MNQLKNNCNAPPPPSPAAVSWIRLLRNPWCVCVCVCVQVDDDLTDKNTPSDSRVKDSYIHKKRKKERKKK